MITTDQNDIYSVYHVHVSLSVAVEMEAISEKLMAFVRPSYVYTDLKWGTKSYGQFKFQIIIEEWKVNGKMEMV